MKNSEFLGFGLGLRTPHFEHILQHNPQIDWFEILSENFMVAGGKPRYYLNAIAERYPLVMHGVSLSIGSTQTLDLEYLKQLKTLAQEVNPRWISDHLCFAQAGGVNSHDLLPLPYTQEAISHVAQRVRQVQDFLGRQILLENVSSYLTYKDSQMSEWEFYNSVCAQADCLMLLDINNIYVSARNHGFAPEEYLYGIDKKRVQQIHLAGHTDMGDHVIDTHDAAICDPVWALYAKAVEHLGPVASMIERDDNIPAFTELEAELNLARNIASAHCPAVAAFLEKQSVVA